MLVSAVELFTVGRRNDLGVFLGRYLLPRPEGGPVRQHAAQHRVEVADPGALPIAVHRDPDGRRVVVTALLRFVEAPREPVLCPDSVRS
jgi:hypothetical protein